VERTCAALDRPRGRAPVPKDEVDELRIVASWIAEHEPAHMPLEPAPDDDALADFAAGAAGERQPDYAGA
jgi:hypothetical protein